MTGERSGEVSLQWEEGNIPLNPRNGKKPKPCNISIYGRIRSLCSSAGLRTSRRIIIKMLCGLINFPV